MHKLLLLICLLCLQQKTFAQQAISVKALSDKGQPMIFLPHIGCSSEMWREMAEKYKNTHACYLLDFAGFAGMPPLTGNFTQEYVEGIITFIKEKQLSNCILVGQNYGGYVAVKVARQLPETVKALVLSDFYPKLSKVLGENVSSGQLDTILSAIKTFNNTTDSAQFSAYNKQMAEGMNFSNPVMVEKFVQWQSQSDRETLAETLSTQMKDDLIPFFQKNTIPVLVYTTWYFAIKFKNMPLSEAGKSLEGMYPGAKNVTHAITENAKDFIANDQPEWFAAQLNQFLKLEPGAK